MGRIPGETYRRSLKSIRLKYRPGKGLARRLKRSRPGASTMRVREKDIQAARDMAASRGLKFHHLGSADGVAKIKLMGDDSSIDEVAKHFGRRG